VVGHAAGFLPVDEPPVGGICGCHAVKIGLNVKNNRFRAGSEGTFPAKQGQRFEIETDFQLPFVK